MKIKILFLATVFAFGFFSANAQAIQKGDKVLNLGIGLGSALYSGSYYKSSVPPISASLEAVIKDGFWGGKFALGLGGYLGYSSFKSTYDYGGGTYGWKYSNIIIGPRGYLHYSFMDKLDTYAGLMIGYWIATNKEYGTIGSGYSAGSYGGLITSEFIGARYFFNDKFAGMAEIGAGISYLNLGVAVKF
ncbi:MAG: hypothetical protein HXX13_03770 [Bacteroidetes bacterium]|nr:hypothetical protein [Bacteroidota bacterium]